MIKFIEFFGWDKETRASFRRDWPAMALMLLAFVVLGIVLILMEVT